MKFPNLAIQVQTFIRKGEAFGNVLEVHAGFVVPQETPRDRYGWDGVEGGPLQNVKLRLMAFGDYTHIPHYPTSWVSNDLRDYTVNNVDNLAKGLKLVNKVYYRYIDKGGVKPHTVGEYLHLMARLLGLRNEAFIRMPDGSDKNVYLSGLVGAVDGRIGELMPNITGFRI